jgi:hypothetical protein
MLLIDCIFIDRAGLYRMKRLKVLLMVMTSIAAMAGITSAVVAQWVGAATEANTALGRPFLIGEDILTSFKPVNKTYTEVSYAGNRTIFPPNAPDTAMINATERGNLTFNLVQKVISIVEGQSLLVTKPSSNNGSEQEKATALLVDINGIKPEDPRSSTGVAYFMTNSTGKLAFLNNMVAIYQVKVSPVGTAIKYWEWKGAELP